MGLVHFFRIFTPRKTNMFVLKNSGWKLEDELHSFGKHQQNGIGNIRSAGHFPSPVAKSLSLHEAPRRLGGHVASLALGRRKALRVPGAVPSEYGGVRELGVRFWEEVGEAVG